MSPLRSNRWYERDDEVALLHRAALRAAVPGWRPGRPIVGIADSSSDLNPCNLPVRRLLPDVTGAVEEAGGSAFTFPVMSLGEDLVKPSAMLYRNLVAMELEETVRAHPLDALVITTGCDKTTAAALMAAAVVGVPTLLLPSGSRPPVPFRGRPLGTGTDLWRALEARRLDRLDDTGWAELERCLSCTTGTCNTMGTASTLALVAEALGVQLPGTSGHPADSPAAHEAAAATGRRAVAMVRERTVPADLMTAGALDNAVRVVAAVGGSTNAVVHLAAVAGRLGHPFDLTGRVDRMFRETPLTVEVEPNGPALIGDLAEAKAAGLPGVMAAHPGLFDLGVTTADGRSWQEVADLHRAAEPVPAPPVRTAESVAGTRPALAVVRGSLAPDGAVLKVSAASPQLLRHRGPAFVVDDYHTMRALTDDASLELPPDVVLVIRGCGPVGVPGMPEWGMAPVPLNLARQGVRDVLRVTDGRMSGTSYGTVVLHVAPESAVGGPLALVRDGDLVELDVDAGRLDLLVDPAELTRRRERWQPPESGHLRGWPLLYRRHVLQAPQGCDLDFLTAPTARHRHFVEPVIGRS